MTELGESAFASTEIAEEPADDGQEKIKIRYSVFFDGTLNNRTNINQRLVSAADEKLTDEEREAAAELKAKMTLEDIQKAKGIYKKREGQGSYENGYTNIVKLEQYTETEPSDPYELVLASYIEGAGTQDKKGDKTLGYAIGMGTSGIRNKVKKGVLEVVKKIRVKHKDTQTKIEVLTLDVFGFSRGAATARSFIFKALYDANSIAEQLESQGYNVGKVDVCFAGLYDTVSSHGLSFSNDTSTLKLHAVAQAKDTLHLTAADEHRENFSLTDIKSTWGKGREIYLPGVHSDVGGSYREGASEAHDIYWTMDMDGEAKAKKEKQQLVAAGWYKEDELTIKTNLMPGHYGRQEVVLHAHRSNISNHYSRIPLHIMAQFARENKINFEAKFELNEKIPAELDQVYQAIQQYVEQHKSPGAYSSKPADWHGPPPPWLKELRYRYFHFSARLELGNGPRYINGRRQRMYYRG